MKIIPEANWKEDMKVFRTAAAKYYAGELKRAEYKGISGKFGSYAQKGDKPLSMLRLRMPAGRLTPKKMAFIADSVRKYARSPQLPCQYLALSSPFLCCYDRFCP